MQQTVKQAYIVIINIKKIRERPKKHLNMYLIEPDV